MGSRWREFIEHLLPWFDPLAARQRDARTERIRQRSVASRIQAERIIADYQRASTAAPQAGDRLGDETRAGDER